jgi:hypothetical protein
LAVLKLKETKVGDIKEKPDVNEQAGTITSTAQETKIEEGRFQL